MSRVYIHELRAEYPDEDLRSEALVAEYFRRREFKADPIDDGNHLRPPGQGQPDLLISSATSRFLCEVKTVHSARRGDGAEEDFDNGFGRPLQRYFAENEFDALAYAVVIDNSTMTVLSSFDLGCFCEWLADGIRAIHNATPRRDWRRDDLGFGLLFTGRYRVARTEGRAGELHVRVTPNGQGHLSVEVPSYGAINRRRLQKVMSVAKDQLADEAAARGDPSMPRVVAVSVRDDCWLGSPVVVRAVRDQLAYYSSLSAVALFAWTPEGMIPPWEPSADWFLAFEVFHNAQLTGTRPLPSEAFADGVSKQHFSS